ncbi:MAG: tRNA dihydrouridine synthase DusB [Saprospiraceae bacterium]|uniref:tRNA-dihydrouridine synthase n=1 Tax=Candidatus Opimibacter skivensis TaxID=2982028 RepID=A0A9D7SR25_9BACT|nr:tRNA dihydrouridine synthase DusB [Candidatus Opimibacter skivensis]
MVKIRNLELGEFPLLLAPMEDVSDPPFRVLCKEFGADLLFTEFISSEGLIRDAIKSRKKLEFYERERPIGIQIFGGDEEAMAMSATIVDAVQPDLVDINFGCPVKKVVCKGAGAAVLKDIDLMVRLTKAVVKSTHLPVTVKTRLGWDDNSINIMEVAERLQDVGIEALSIHGRTRAQLYKGEADWTMIGKVKNNPAIRIPIFGNGDIDTPQKARLYRDRYGVDGIMIGRASIGYPWIFREIKHFFSTGQLLAEPTLHERVNAARKHLQHSIEWKGEKVGVMEMKRHYSNYFRSLEGIKQYRSRLVTESEPSVLFDILHQIESHYSSELVEIS